MFSAAKAPNMVALDYFAPPPELASYFGAMYLFTADQQLVADHTRADFAQIRFMLTGSGNYLFQDGRATATPSCCLLGPTSAATHFKVIGPLQVIGISVLPLGWAALGVGGAQAIADDLLDLADRCGPQWEEMLRRLRLLESLDVAADMLWGFLADQMQDVTEAERVFVAATDAWLADERSPRIDRLQEATSLSARQVARWCNRLYGAPPKYLARKYRALRCALLLARDNVEWTELCDDGAFYDQSHFIREMRHFIGLTPTELRERSSIVIRLSMNRRDVDGNIARLSRIS